MPNFIFKPNSGGQVNPGGASVLTTGNYSSGAIYDEKGNKVSDLQRSPNKEGNTSKFYTQQPGSSFGKNFTVGLTDSEGKVTHYKIGEGGQRYEGDDPNSLSPVNKGGGTGGGKFDPGHIGYGSTPSYVGGEFPSPVLGQYTDTKTAPYNFTDPFKFAEAFGAFNRGEINKNFNQSQDLALRQLDTELQSLRAFVPAASALKRNETSIDNLFNQATRSSQVGAVLPNAAGDLEAQRGRANAFAAGRLPDELGNQAFETGVRSNAADNAAFGGFGASSSVSRKASDLLSAESRVKLSQYGDQLLSNNIGTSANLFLAPTEYSNAGGQVNVNPSVSASQLIGSNLAQVNNLASISAAQGLQSNTQQNQFATNEEQQNRQFNASNKLQLSEFNANTQNQMALDLFNYKVAYSGALAGSNQTDINTKIGLQQQQEANQITRDYINKSQSSDTLKSIFGGVSALGGAGGIASALSSAGSFAEGLFGFNTNSGAGGSGAFSGAVAGASNGANLAGQGLFNSISNLFSGGGGGSYGGGGSGAFDGAIAGAQSLPGGSLQNPFSTGAGLLNVAGSASRVIGGGANGQDYGSTIGGGIGGFFTGGSPEGINLGAQLGSAAVSIGKGLASVVGK